VADLWNILMTNMKQMAIHDCGTSEITYRELTDEEIASTIESQRENDAITEAHTQSVQSVADWVNTVDGINQDVKNAMRLLLGVPNATQS
jgi:hypothetical protein